MDEQTRVLHVVGRMDRGGAETMLMNIYRNIDRAKLQFDFMVHTNDKCAYDDEILSLGGRIFRVSKFKGINILNYSKQWNDFFKTQPEIKVIHGHIGGSAAIYLSIANKYKCSTIAHSHNTNHGNLLYPLFSYPTRYIAKYLFACSNDAGIYEYGQKIWELNHGIVLNNAIDIKKFIFDINTRNRIRINFNLENKFVVGHVGRFDTQKNHMFLLDIFSEIHKQKPDSILLLVGDGALRGEIEGKIEKLNLKDSVILTGVRSDVADLLQAMDVFVFPSLYEGLGIVVIEAQASGLHCVISDPIPEDAAITNLVEQVSLKKSSKHWSDTILKYSQGYPRENTYDKITEAGYDIAEAATWLTNFYLENN